MNLPPHHNGDCYSAAPKGLIPVWCGGLLHQLKKAVFRFNHGRIEKKIIRASREDNDFFFIQIGSNDGVSGDPIHKFVVSYRWQGVLVEPVRYLFRMLLATYKNQPGLFFENAAIDKEAGYKSFYSVRKVNGPDHALWYEKLGSFNKEHLLKHRRKIPDFDDRLIEEKVRCMTLKDLLIKYNINKINLLHIDAEGYDYEIIKTIPFNEIKPIMILYENKHLSVSDKSACKELLRSHGYKLIKSKDTFAYL